MMAKDNKSEREEILPRHKLNALSSFLAFRTINRYDTINNKNQFPLKDLFLINEATKNIGVASLTIFLPTICNVFTW